MTPDTLLSVASIRAIESAWLAALPAGTLMRRAATALADAVARVHREQAADAPVLLLIGPGNNGGDALLAGQLLQQRGIPVQALVVPALLTAPPRPDDAARIWAQWSPARLRPLAEAAALLARHPRAVVVDGLFGIGLGRAIDGELAATVARVATARAHGARVVAVDVPSGLDADRGTAIGAGALLAADLTLTFIADKPGLHTARGRAAAGQVEVARLLRPVVGEPVLATTIDLAALARAVDSPDPARRSGTLLSARAVRGLVPWRDDDAHKGQHGDVLVIGGRLGMAGAARLAARGAIAGGAGRVAIAEAAPPARSRLQNLPPIDPERPEIMRRTLAADDPLTGLATRGERSTVLVAGCGLGRDDDARDWLRRVLAASTLVVLDADALTLLAGWPQGQRLLRARRGLGHATVLTPHPLEAARLLAVSVADIASDRVAAARALAEQTDTIVLLKGAGTVVAGPGGHYAINASGHPVLATGGSGDVLAGLIGALAATSRGLGRPDELAAASAACLGAWLHGAAGEWLARHVGPIGVPAGRIAEVLPAVFAQLAATVAEASTDD